MNPFGCQERIIALCLLCDLCRCIPGLLLACSQSTAVTVFDCLHNRRTRKQAVDMNIDDMDRFRNREVIIINACLRQQVINAVAAAAEEHYAFRRQVPQKALIKILRAKQMDVRASGLNQAFGIRNGIREGFKRDDFRRYLCIFKYDPAAAIGHVSSGHAGFSFNFFQTRKIILCQLIIDRSVCKNQLKIRDSCCSHSSDRFFNILCSPADCSCKVGIFCSVIMYRTFILVYTCPIAKQLAAAFHDCFLFAAVRYSAEKLRFKYNIKIVNALIGKAGNCCCKLGIIVNLCVWLIKELNGRNLHNSFCQRSCIDGIHSAPGSIIIQSASVTEFAGQFV